MNLSNVRVVLVGTTHPGNIGAAARAIKTMGLTQMSLVVPQCEIDEEARARASGAIEILENTVTFPNLSEAVRECRWVVGTSARRRRFGPEMKSPRDCTEEIAEYSTHGPCAVVFGRERNGLTNEELLHCQRLCRIPTGDTYASLNLAAAVQVMAYEMRVKADDLYHEHSESVKVDCLATQSELSQLYAHWRSVLEHAEFFLPSREEGTMKRLVHLLNRARLRPDEVQLLRGMLSAIQERISIYNN